MIRRLHLAFIVVVVYAAATAAQQTAPGAAAFQRLDKNNDGRITRDGAPTADSLAAADADKDGAVTPEEFRRYLTSRPRPQTPNPILKSGASTATLTPPPVDGRPVLKALPDSDAVRDAAGTGQLFECVHVPGLTDIRKGVNGFAIADLNRDGFPDFIATVSPPVSLPGVAGATTGSVDRVSRRTAVDQLLVLVNEGGFRFREHRVEIRDSKLTPEAFDSRAQVPNLADFNGDGFLDVFFTRHSPVSAGHNRGNLPLIGNTLLVSDGEWDRFVDVSAKMGTRNELAYNRQSSIGDVDGDGWLDIAIGCDNIGNALGGVAYSRLYVFKPNGRRFEDGTFEDIGGSDLIPDFGGFYHDFDNDGWLDLIVLDRRENPHFATRSMLWMNRGDGTFVVKPTEFSGLDGSGISAEATDLNRDGLLDLFIAADPDNTGIATDIARYESKVYWNTGEHGAKRNHWLHLTFTGLSHAELIGARVELTVNGKQQFR